MINEARWDPAAGIHRSDVQFEIGRRLVTSAANRRQPSTQVTPDLVVQFGEAKGIVGEAKLSLPRDIERWDGDVEQLEKYDDDLEGWWTGSGQISDHDIVALIPLPRAVEFKDRIEDGIGRDRWRFVRNLSVVAFSKVSGIKEFICLKREWGKLGEQALDERLRKSKMIPREKLLKTYNDRKFVDHEPPLPYVLQILWDSILSRYALEAPNREEEKWKIITISVAQLASDAQEYYGSKSSGPRSPGIPRIKTIKRAMDALVAFKMAARTEEEGYAVHYRRGRGDTLVRFGRLCWRLSRRTGRGGDRTPLLPGFGGDTGGSQS